MLTMEESIIDLLSLGICKYIKLFKVIGLGWVYTTIISFEMYPFGYT